MAPIHWRLEAASAWSCDHTRDTGLGDGGCSPHPTPVGLRNSDELAGQREKLCADIWHHRGLFLAQAGDTNVIKSVFKLDNILDISAEMPEHEKLLPSRCASPNSNSGAV